MITYPLGTLTFSGGSIFSSNGHALEIPFLHSARYETNLGTGVIGFNGNGTRDYNIREHGGDFTLQSFFGFKKSIHI